MPSKRSGALPAPSFLAGGGEMGERTRSMDWSRTPLGPVDRWPQSLRSTLSMLLPSKAQIILFWGDDFIVFYNDAYRPVFGGKHPHALGKPGREAWSEIWDSVLHELLQGVVHTGEAFWAKDLRFTIERYGFEEETYFDVSYDPVRVESGHVGGVFCIVTETTERVIGERRMMLLKDLAANNATARTERDACVLAMRTLAARPQDITFALVYRGDELLSGTSEAEAQLAVSRPELVRECTVTSTSANAPAARVVVGLNPQRPFDDAYRGFVDLVCGQIATALANARAYEDERERAEALAELDRAKTAFFSNVSHEFRTPLTLLLGPVQDALESPERSLGPDALATVHRNALRLLKLVNTLLDFARIEAGRAEAQYEPTNLSACTVDLAGAFRSAIESAGLQFEVQCTAENTTVSVDRSMWEKLVFNLLSNALKFTFAGRIRLTLERDGDAVRLAVSDTGTGIPADQLPHVFERFHRVRGASARTLEGTGIGLALVQEIVRLHGGTIDVDSADGSGTTFTVRIPVDANYPAGASAAPRPLEPPTAGAGVYVGEAMGWTDTSAGRVPSPPPGAGAVRILLADDNADMRAYVGRLLGQRWHVEVVADGAAALDAVHRQRPDVVVADVMMPGLSGFELLAALRADPVTRDIPVVLLSARAGEEATLKGLAAGADEYLVKPFSARDLLARVEAQVNRARDRDEMLRVQHELADANRVKDEFLAMLGHELRNPLAPISTAVQLLKMQGGQSRELAVIERQVSHLKKLVDDLLDVSRITRGKVELDRRPIELWDAVARAIEVASPVLEQRRHLVDVFVPSSGLVVDGDIDRIAQVIANLLTNAAKYSDPDSRITIRAERADGDVRLKVEDQGMGIAPEMLGRVFEAFVQQPQAIDRSRGGLGLGLAIVRSLVELHGGRVRAESQGVGHGSTFVVELPLAKVTKATAAAPATEAVPSASGRHRVLVVDDNADSAAMLADALTRMGYRVAIAHDGPTALQHAQSFAPDAALLDIGLPVMDGYELAARLRDGIGPDGRLALIAITGYGQDTDRERSAQAGFQRHLVKPIDLHQLASVLEAALRD